MGTAKINGLRLVGGHPGPDFTNTPHAPTPDSKLTSRLAGDSSPDTPPYRCRPQELAPVRHTRAKQSQALGKT